MAERPPHDAAFAKYVEGGAYHWREIGAHPLHHHAFTAERYRRTLTAAGPLSGRRVLDYGCGDGALLGWIARRVGHDGAAYGFDPNGEARTLAAGMLARHKLSATLLSDLAELPDESLDVVICAEVIEHVHDPTVLLGNIHRVLRRAGVAVITTPVRLTESPEDPNHVVEWFPSEFRALLEAGPLRLERHEQIIPVAAVEAYFWRPWFCLRVPVLRLGCNLLSITTGMNALSALRLRPRLFMTQLAILTRP